MSDEAYKSEAPPTQEEIVHSAMMGRDKMLAHWIAGTIQLAAELHPDVLKAALGHVFDVSAINERTKSTASAIEAVRKAARSLHAEVRKLREEMATLRAEFDSLHLMGEKLDEARAAKKAKQKQQEDLIRKYGANAAARMMQ